MPAKIGAMSQEPQGASEPISRRGMAVDASDPALLARAIEAAFDYRGDVTVTRRSTGESVEGYVFDRTSGPPGPGSVIRMIPAGGEGRLTIPCSDIAQIRFSGRDTAEGKSFETWVKNYLRRKLTGEEASLRPDPLEE